MPAIDNLTKIIAIQMGVDASTITAETEIVNDLGADSLDVAELFMGIEEEFGLLLTEEMTADIITVGELGKLIDAQLSN
jgi:acyl carrier protein